MENKVYFYVGYSTFETMKDGKLKEYPKSVPFIKKYLSSKEAGSSVYGWVSDRVYCFSSKEQRKINNLKRYGLGAFEL